ncbi:MAG: membrane protein insertase YidC [Nitrospirae bacterium]|nr:membrane protein insertase YidC [Nitrospirota bacterium]
MEKRTLLAVVLSMLVLFLWYVIFQPKQPDTAPPAATQEQKPGEASTETVEPTAQMPAGSSALNQIAADVSAGEDVVVETDLYKAVFSTKGAVITYWELKNYKDKEGTPVVLLKKPGATAPLAMLLEGSNRGLPQNIIFNTTAKDIRLSENGEREGKITFSYENQGLSIRKNLLFHNNDYRVDISIDAVNTPDYMLPVGSGFGLFNVESGMQIHSGPILLLDSTLEKFDEKKSDKYVTGNIRWIAQEDKYFTAALIPKSSIIGANAWKEQGSPEIAFKSASGKRDFVLYAGPKEYDRLSSLNMGLEHIIDFGWFSVVAVPLFWFLKFLYKFLGNYGWAIIIMTIAVRIPFIPLLNKSQQSMKKMQKIQPMMAEIKEKYKKDPQRQQKEMMELYKKYKVNPLGGCLPMLLQIPVFIALYNVLLQAIELRGAPFMLWITDLATKDPYYILPVVMGASMVLQQKMTPTTVDPAQAKVMMILPVIFTVMFLTFPSGLVIYWLVNNILAIVQQYFINQKAEA